MAELSFLFSFSCWRLSCNCKCRQFKKLFKVFVSQSAKMFDHLWVLLEGGYSCPVEWRIFSVFKKFLLTLISNNMCLQENLIYNIIYIYNHTVGVAYSFILRMLSNIHTQTQVKLATLVEKSLFDSYYTEV